MTNKIFTRLNEFLASLPKTSLDDKDYKYLSKAEQISKKSTRNRHRVGAVIVSNNTIVATGVNTEKTHPFQKKYNPFSEYLHAETEALLNAMKNESVFNPRKSTIYVSRYTRKGVLGCSYPCVYCWNAINHIGIRKIVCYDETDTPTKIVLD